MRPGNGYLFRFVVLALLASMFAACASVPPRRDETPEILVIRDDFLRANPNGPFNREIERGEIALGMGYRDVLAAWGMPDARVADDDVERWTYLLVSDNGADWVRYDFVFDNRTVTDWESTRSVASGFAPVRDDARGVSRRLPPTTTGFGDGVRKGWVGSTTR